MVGLGLSELCQLISTDGNVEGSRRQVGYIPVRGEEVEDSGAQRYAGRGRITLSPRLQRSRDRCHLGLV